MFHNRFRFSLVLGAIAAAFVMIAADVADARSRVSGGSRGTRTQSAPPTTTTAPTARPVERTMTQPTNPGSNLASRPALQNSPAAGLINRPGFMGGMFAGLLGAGLIGLLLGGGLTGGLGGLASFLGLALQIGIVVLIGWLLFTWWQRRSSPRPRWVRRCATCRSGRRRRPSEPAAASVADLAAAWAHPGRYGAAQCAAVQPG